MHRTGRVSRNIFSTIWSTVTQLLSNKIERKQWHSKKKLYNTRVRYNALALYFTWIFRGVQSSYVNLPLQFLVTLQLVLVSRLTVSPTWLEQRLFFKLLRCTETLANIKVVNNFITRKLIYTISFNSYELHEHWKNNAGNIFRTISYTNIETVKRPTNCDHLDLNSQFW